MTAGAGRQRRADRADPADTPTRAQRRAFHDQDRLTANRHGKSFLIMKEAATPWQARRS